MQKQNATLDYRDLLFQRLERLKAKNPQFSVRRWADELDLNPGTLSAILNKKRHLPLKEVQKLKTKLNLSSSETQLIVDSLFKQKISSYSFEKKQQKAFELKDDLHFKVMAEWEHYAVLYLFDLKGFQWDTDWISKKLGLTQGRAMEIMDNLLKLNLIKQKSLQRAERSHANLTTTNDIRSAAIQAGHKNRLNKAIESLSLDLNLREFQAHTFAIQDKHLPMLKEMIRDFVTKVESDTSSQQGETLMQLNIQLFPLTAKGAV